MQGLETKNCWSRFNDGFAKPLDAQKVSSFDTQAAAPSHFASSTWQVIKLLDTSKHVQQLEGIYE
jgi:hypothetical protein